MAYSTQRAVSDGTLVLLNLSLDYFDRSEIAVLLNGIVSPTTSGKWAWVGTTNKQISFTPAVANGVEVTIKRTTNNSAPLNQYTKGAQFVAETLDDNFTQVLRIAQEASEGAGATDVFSDVDHHGYKLKNVGPAVDPGDAVSLGQYQADAAGASASKAAAATSASSAATSATSASGSATAAATSASNAATSETNALSYKNSAGTSAGNASTSATAADNSAKAAATSATNAGTSETNALASKNAAATSAASVVRDGSGGVAGLTGWLLNLYNAAGTIKSAIASVATAARTWTFPDKSGTIALMDDVANPVVNSLNGGPLSGSRNRIINGNMRINQRGAANIAPKGFAADRWAVDGGTANANIIGNQYNDGIVSITGPSHLAIVCGTAKAVLSAGDYAYMVQCIENWNWQDLRWGTAAAKPVTVSLRGYASVAGIYTLSIRNGDSSRSYCVPISMGVGAGSYSVTIPGDTSGAWSSSSGIGAQLGLTMACGTTFSAPTASTWLSGNYIGAPGQSNGLDTVNRVFAASDVQLEQGTTATPYEVRSYGLELLLCQRYYATVVSPVAFCGSTVAGNSYYATYTLPTVMRAMATLTGTNQNGAGFPTTVGTLGMAGDYRVVYEMRAASSATSNGLFGSQISANAEFS